MVAPRIRLGSAKDITSFFIYLTLQSYDVMLIPPNFWDILHGNVTNVTFSSYLCDLRGSGRPTYIWLPSG